MIFSSIWEAILSYVFVLGVFFLFLNFRWIWREIRNISEDKGGFIKLCQLLFIVLSWIIFIFILIYYIVHPNKVNTLDIILTVIVGFLGTMMGLFFNEEALERVEKEVQRKGKKIRKSKLLLEDFKILLKELKEKKN